MKVAGASESVSVLLHKMTYMYRVHVRNTDAHV